VKGKIERNKQIKLSPLTNQFRPFQAAEGKNKNKNFNK
jgi:hypothetical protein